ncbi:MAG: GLPGLI family protein [Phocaeicola sp.]
MRLLFILFLLYPLSLFSQYIEIIEPTLFECEYYKQQVSDTLQRETAIKAEYMRLRVGATSSMFYSPKELSNDSLSYDTELWTRAYLEGRKNKVDPAGPFRERVYKNFPMGKITVFNHFSLMHWRCEEDWEQPTWHLIDSVKQVLNYDCQFATTHYRGRTWYAWFTVDIPVSEGPWKLCGLPGLILEAFDNRRDYSFVATAIYTQNIEAVGIYDYYGYSWAKTTREKYYKTWDDAIRENLSVKMAAAYGLTFDTSTPAKPKVVNYDLEEIYEKD